MSSASDRGVTVVIEQRGGRSRRLTLERSSVGRGIFEGVFTEATEGEYEVMMPTEDVEGRPPSTSFLVSAPPGEFQHTAMDVEELTRAASATHGKYYTVQNADRLIDELPQGRQIPVETLPPQMLSGMDWYPLRRWRLPGGKRSYPPDAAGRIAATTALSRRS